MSTASTDQPPPQEPAARLQNIASPRPSMPEHLPCPRCDSPNTKFCYYNNYNLSQPRYFCKSCRRYWTRGGTLRNVPVGGGSRKSSANKRFRSTPSATGTPTAAAATITSSSSSSTLTFNDLSPPKPAVVKAENGYGPSPCRGGVNLNEVAVGDFGSLLTSQQQGDGFVQMANFGFGFGFGLGSGFGTWDWPAEQVEEADVGGRENVSGGGVATGCNTWQLACVESGLPEGDRYGWPDLAISAPGKSLE